MKTEIAKVENGSGRNLPDVYTVSKGGEIVGMVTRFKGKGSPWMAYRGIGNGTEHVGTTYVSRAEAVDMILSKIRADEIADGVWDDCCRN
jgi:hypothetical protein